MRLIFRNRFCFVHIPFGSMDKSEFLAQFLVVHLLHPFVSSLVLFCACLLHSLIMWWMVLSLSSLAILLILNWSLWRCYVLPSEDVQNDAKNFYSSLKDIPPVPALLRFWVQIEPKRKQDPEKLGWAFRWCTKQAIFYQRQGHWTTTTSLSERVTRRHSHPGGSSDKLSVNYPAAKHPDLTQFMQKSIRRVDQRWRINFCPSFRWYRWNNNYRRTSRTPPSSIFINGNGTDMHVMITAVSPYFQFRARS